MSLEGVANMSVLTMLILLLGAQPAQSVTVETAVGNWDNLPKLEARGPDHLNHGAILEVHQAAIEAKCRLPGQRGGDLHLNLPFAAQFGPDGALNRILLPKLDCPRAEGILGGVLVEMIKGGDYRPSGENLAGWYQGVLSFTSEQ